MEENPGIKDGKSTANVINRLTSHWATVAVRWKGDVAKKDLSSMKELKSFYCFHFVPKDGAKVEIRAFTLTREADLPNAVPKKTFVVDVQFLIDRMSETL